MGGGGFACRGSTRHELLKASPVRLKIHSFTPTVPPASLPYSLPVRSELKSGQGEDSWRVRGGIYAELIACCPTEPSARVTEPSEQLPTGTRLSRPLVGKETGAQESSATCPRPETMGGRVEQRARADHTPGGSLKPLASSAGGETDSKTLVKAVTLGLPLLGDEIKGRLLRRRPSHGKGAGPRETRREHGHPYGGFSFPRGVRPGRRRRGRDGARRLGTRRRPAAL